jgi:hypothetical protein
MKISHRELEDCRRSPKAWAQARTSASGFFTFGYNQALLNSIHKYHRKGEAEARKHLRALIDEHFTNDSRIDQLEDDFDSYVKWHRQSGIVVADSNIRIAYSIGGFLELGGLISRLDMMSPGYRAVLVGIPRETWRDELRMPLIQEAIARKYGRPVDEVSVGVQRPDGSHLDQHKFRSSDVARARSELSGLGETVRPLFPPGNP